MWTAALALLLLVLTQWPTICAAEEKILSFDSRITVHEDASLTVVETIQVRAEQNRIRQGIYRDFPTRYKGGRGEDYNVGFSVVSVARDGRPEPFHTEQMGNGVRVYVGRKGVFLNPGVYTYELAYATDRQIGFFERHDELYWNVTGNGWVFPIDRASARVYLPPAAQSQVLFTDFYTGPQGAKGKNASARRDVRGEIVFETTTSLGPAEGLTIVAGWPKGVVREPTRAEKAGHFLGDNMGVFVGLAGLFIVIAYFILTWARVGRDPERGTIIPFFSPPEGMSPAAVRFVRRMGADDKTFAAAVISMAVKGALTIRDDNGSYTLTKTQGGGSSLSPEEARTKDKLFGSSGSIELKKANHRAVSGAVGELKSILNKGYEKTYFLTNRKYFFPGAALSLLSIIAMAVLGSHAGEGAFLSLWLTFWSIGVLFLSVRLVSLWKGVFSGGWKIAGLGEALFFTLFSIPFLGGEVLGLFALGASTSPIAIVLLMVIVGMNVFFYWALKAPTSLGRRILDKIEGFRMFLAVTERERLNLLNPPERTPELFERFLPYALALDVEHEWAEQFTEVLARAGRAGKEYAPSWYSGRSWSPSGARSFAGALGGSLAGAIASSSTAPGSSSGGGGGGSSGGGGGGGGGGGW